MNFDLYFDRIFAGNEAGGEGYRVLFEQLGNLGFEGGRGITGITVGILMILRAPYKDKKKLKALVKLSGPDEGFNDHALHLEARRSLLPLFELALKAREGVTKEAGMRRT